jgi:hypothetical protein
MRLPETITAPFSMGSREIGSRVRARRIMRSAPLIVKSLAA